VRCARLHSRAADYLVAGKTSNHTSGVLRVGNGAEGVLFTADIEADDEQALLARAPALLAPPHGGKGSSTPDFINAVGAVHIVLAPGAADVLAWRETRRRYWSG